MWPSSLVRDLWTFKVIVSVEEMHSVQFCGVIDNHVFAPATRVKLGDCFALTHTSVNLKWPWDGEMLWHFLVIEKKVTYLLTRFDLKLTSKVSSALNCTLVDFLSAFLQCEFWLLLASFFHCSQLWYYSSLCSDVILTQFRNNSCHFIVEICV